MMKNSSIKDNWSLQDLGYTLEHGLSFEDSGYYAINLQDKTFQPALRPQAINQLEVFFDVLSDIVLRDSIYLDEAYKVAWSGFADLERLTSEDIIFSIEYDKTSETSQSIKADVLKTVCVTAEMRDIQKKNEISFAKYRQSDDRFFSQVIWGLAGIMGSTENMEAFITPHPVRRMVLDNVLNAPSHCIDITNEFMQLSQNLNNRVLQHKLPNANNVIANVSIPPIVLELLNEVNTMDEIVPVVLQLRDRYKKLRKWLGKYQNTVYASLDKLDKYKNVLVDLENEVNELTNHLRREDNQIRLSSSFTSFGVSKAVETGKMTRKFRNNFGIRSTMKKLVLGQNKMAALDKLFKLFEINNPVQKEVILQGLTSENG